MEFFFRPAAVAIVGASATEGKGGYSIVCNARNGFTGDIYPVNPQYEEILGLPCYPSVTAVPGPVDMAVIFVPAAIVPGVIRDCAEKGVRGVIIQSAGFAETGEAGRAIQDRVLQTARENNIRVWGPNCVGLVDIADRRFFSFISPNILKEGVIAGGVSMIVQSGMLSGGFLMDMMTTDRMGFARVCSIGNKLDVNECDLLAWLLDDPQTRAVGCYLENLADGRRLIELCRQSDKPVVVLKGGKTEHGARAAMSHTASMAADHNIISGILARAGAIEASDFKEMADICNTLSLVRQRPETGKGRVAVLTYSGGAGILSTDLMAGRRLCLAELQPQTLDKMRPVFPDWMPVGNPVDFWPAVEKSGPIKTYLTCVKAVLEDPGVDMILLHVFLGGRMRLDMAPLVAAAEQAGKSLFCWAIGHDQARRELTDSLREYGVPVFRELGRAVACMDALVGCGHGRKNGRQTAGAAQDEDRTARIRAAAGRLAEKKNTILDEYDAKRVLCELGIPVVDEVPVANAGEAAGRAGAMGFPVVLKGLLPEVVHKTEAGLVRLGLTNPADVKAAAVDLLQAMGPRGRLLVQKQVSGRVELIAGLVRDPQAGPCVMVGLGGVLAEILDDVVFSPAPLSTDEALALIDRLRSQKILNGFRDVAPVDRPALAEILTALGDLGDACRAVQEIDLNPVVICDGRPVVVDAAMVLKPKAL